DDVIRPQRLNCYHVKPGMMHDIHHQACVENMVVEASEFSISLRPLAERVGIAYSGIPREIVQREDLFQVGKVVLPPVCLEVLNQVGYCCYRPPVVERAVAGGHHENQSPTRAEYTLPLSEGTQRVCCMFEHMRGKDEIVLHTGDAAEVGALRDESLPRRFPRIEIERVALARRIFPYRAAREGDI